MQGCGAISSRIAARLSIAPVIPTGFGNGLFYEERACTIQQTIDLNVTLIPLPD